MSTMPIPSSYTFSPSQATPHLTINHDVAADLDSTNAFEGALALSPPLDSLTQHSERQANMLLLPLR